jgi:hypothetical protein
VTGLKQIVRMLEGQRGELLAQLDAVDKAIAALGSLGRDAATDAAGAPATASDGAAPQAAGTVLPTRVRAKRVLSDAHKAALIAGKRKAREAHDVASGLAREMPGEAFVPAIGTRRDRHAPRLIKKPVKN